MVHPVCIRLVPHGNSTPITPSNIHFLDNRFHPLATSRKVCGAWREQSEVKGKWHSARRWSTPGSRQALARLNWRRSSDATNPLLPALKAVSAGSTLSSWSSWRAPLALTRLSYWRSLKPPRSPTTGFETGELEHRNAFPGQMYIPSSKARQSESTKPGVWLQQTLFPLSHNPQRQIVGSQ